MGSLLISFLTLSAALVGPGYAPIGGHDGVDVYQRKDAALIELAAVGEFDAPPSEVQAALLDYSSATRVTQRLAESRVLSRRAGDLTVYQYLKLPVIKDRDFTLHVLWHEGDPRGLTFSIDNGRGPGDTAHAVRMNTLNGRWDLEPIREGTATRATYHVQLDFAGSVPRWMVRGGAAKDLPNLYQGMRKLIVDRRSGKVGAVSSR